MALNIGVQMDPIQSITIRAIPLRHDAGSAGARDKLFYYQTKALLWAARSLPRPRITVRDEAGNHFSLGEERRADLGKCDVVLMRQDPPFDMGYITATHMLEAIHPKTLVVNDPREVRNAPEKLYVLNYPQFMPETLITRDPVELAPSAASTATSF